MITIYQWISDEMMATEIIRVSNNTEKPVTLQVKRCLVEQREL